MAPNVQKLFLEISVFLIISRIRLAEEDELVEDMVKENVLLNVNTHLKENNLLDAENLVKEDVKKIKVIMIFYLQINSIINKDIINTDKDTAKIHLHAFMLVQMFCSIYQF